jgi:hypothetical protein
MIYYFMLLVAVESTTTKLESAEVEVESFDPSEDPPDTILGTTMAATMATIANATMISFVFIVLVLLVYS